MSKVSVLIASRGDTFPVDGQTVLARMLDDLFAKLTGDFEVLVDLDGPPYQALPERPGLTIVTEPRSQGLKPCINRLAALATGMWLLKFDGHCMVSEGLDEILQDGMQPNWMAVPRFYTLDAENWRWQDDHFCDYWLLDCPLTDPKGYRFKAGGYWFERTAQRKDVGPWDETFTHHGSGWFVERDFFLNCLGGMISDGYGSQFMEPADLGLRMWLGPWGGQVMTNKSGWYAHAHKGGQRPRGYEISAREIQRSYLWTANHWMRNEWPQAAHKLEWLVERFWPIPSWPDDWKERQAVYEREHPR